MSTVNAELDHIWRQVVIRQDKWLTIIDKWGEAYERAYVGHAQNLPKQYGKDPSIDAAFGALKGLVGLGAKALLGNPVLIVVVMVPVKSAVGYLGDLAGAPAANSRIESSTVDVSPGVYHKQMSRAVRKAMVGVKERIDDIQEAIRLGKATDRSVDDGTVKRLKAELARSPFWHVPDTWQLENASQIATDLEVGFWAVWASQFKEKKQFVAAWGYDMNPVRKRLQKLRDKHGAKLNNLDSKFFYIVRNGMDIYGQALNREAPRFLAEWGKAYRPPARHQDKVPQQVREFWFREGAKVLLPVMSVAKAALPLKQLRAALN